MTYGAVKWAFAATVTRLGDPGDIPPNGSQDPSNPPDLSASPRNPLEIGCVSAMGLP